MDVGSICKDVAAISAGDWVDNIPGMGDLRLKVRGMTAPSVRQLRGRLVRAVPKDQREDDGTLHDEAARQVLAQVLAEEVLLDWANVEANGEPVLYSPSLAAAWLRNPGMAIFADAVVWAAAQVDRKLAAVDLSGN